MPTKYRVRPSDDERSSLIERTTSGHAPARTITRARILLKADEPTDGDAWTDRQIADALDGAAEARLVQIACSKPPEGRDKWSMRLLAGRMVALGHVAVLSHDRLRPEPARTAVRALRPSAFREAPVGAGRLDGLALVLHRPASAGAEVVEGGLECGPLLVGENGHGAVGWGVPNVRRLT